MRRALAVLAAAFAAAPASAAAQDTPAPLVYALVAAPHVPGSSDLTVPVRCGPHSVSLLDRVRSRARSAVAAVIRAERARIAAVSTASGRDTTAAPSPRPRRR